MKDNRLLNWQIAFTYIGAIIGAGFASGQEILRFFANFGYWGLAGALLAGLLLAYFGYYIIIIATQYSMDSYQQYLVYLYGPRKAKIFDGAICIFLLAGLAVMLVAGGSLFHHLWGWELELGFLVNAIFLYIVMLCGVKGMLWLNSVLIPLLLVISLGVAVEGIRGGGEMLIPEQLAGGIAIENWLLASLLYVAYNSVLAMVVLVTLGKTARSGGSKGVIAGGVALGVMLAVMSLALNMNASIIQGEDLPMLTLAGQQNMWLSKGYSYVLWSAIFTTALGNGLGVLRRIEGICSWPKPVLAALPFIPTLLLFGWPLGRAVGVIYPILGYLGLVLLLSIMVKTMTSKKLYH